MFWKRKTKAVNSNIGQVLLMRNPPSPPQKEVVKIRAMLNQVEVWINSGEKELAKKHWTLIADECRKYGT